jgi:cytochrome c553
MSERVFSLSNRWFVGSIAAVVAIALVSALVGLVWLPRNQSQGAAPWWDAICRAAGLARPYRAEELPPDESALPSTVIVYEGMLAPPGPQAIGHGATLALQCTMCHGARGMSPATSPNLAAQASLATYKQLRDFKSGHRKSAVMAPLVANLSDDDMRDLAAYYASLPRVTPVAGSVVVPSPRLVSNGDPMRNIGACAACHGSKFARAGTPVLDGLPAPYLRLQLEAFARGARHNDINGQMRAVVRNMTSAEMADVARWYSAQ